MANLEARALHSGLALLLVSGLSWLVVLARLSGAQTGFIDVMSYGGLVAAIVGKIFLERYIAVRIDVQIHLNRTISAVNSHTLSF